MRREEKRRINNRINSVFELILKQFEYEATRGGTLFTIIRYLCH